MKIISALSVANAALAVICALLGAAPFTPAPMLLFVLLPLAALFARKDRTFSALSAVGAAWAALFISPIKFSQMPPAPLVVVLGWLLLWSAAVIHFSRRRLGAAVAVSPCRGGSGT
jgi:hypothetical protein